MPLSIPAVQAALKEEGLDGWLLYDFHGSNPIARRLAGIDNGTKTTRRWYYVIPAAGEPRKLVHAIEPHNLDHVPGGKTIYSQRETLASGLKSVLGGLKRIAMEYSPGQQHPVYLAGRRRHRRSGPPARGSTSPRPGDLVQRFEAIWSDEALQTHRAASERLYRIKDRAFALVRDGAPRRTRAHRARRPARDGRLVRGRGADRRQPAGRGRAGKRRRPALRADREEAPGDRRPARSCCSISGASCRSRARSMPTSPGSALQARRSRTDTSRHSTPRATAATRRSRWSRTRSPQGASCAASRSIARAGRWSRRPASARSSCTAPATAWAPRSTATACTWTTSRRTTSAG